MSFKSSSGGDDFMPRSLPSGNKYIHSKLPPSPAALTRHPAPVLLPVWALASLGCPRFHCCFSVYVESPDLLTSAMKAAVDGMSVLISLRTQASSVSLPSLPVRARGVGRGVRALLGRRPRQRCSSADGVGLLRGPGSCVACVESG